MDSAKEIHAPMSTIAKLEITVDSTPVDDVQYRQVIGVLQYLGLTLLDIAFSVNWLAQFMQNLHLYSIGQLQKEF